MIEFTYENEKLMREALIVIERSLRASISDVENYFFAKGCDAIYNQTFFHIKRIFDLSNEDIHSILLINGFIDDKFYFNMKFKGTKRVFPHNFTLVFENDEERENYVLIRNRIVFGE